MQRKREGAPTLEYHLNKQKKKPNKSDILSKTKQQENGLLETTSGLR